MEFSLEMQMKIAESKFLLKQAGYFVDNLWHVDDIMLRYNCNDKGQAQAILYDALTNDATMEQIWFAIDMSAQDDGLELKD